MSTDISMINNKIGVDGDNKTDTSNTNKNNGHFRYDSLFGSSVKKGIQYSIDETMIVGESLSQHNIPG